MKVKVNSMSQPLSYNIVTMATCALNYIGHKDEDSPCPKELALLSNSVETSL